MTYLGRPTLDQLRVFLTVVDVGSFAAAGRQLSRATSVISYTIANLEGQLGVSLFDRESTRKPQLTDAGRTVLAEARGIAHGIDGLRAKVLSLHRGLEAEVHLAVDVMFPKARLVSALREFQAEFPTVTLHLRVEALGSVMQQVLDGSASVGVSGPPDMSTDGVERIAIGSVELAPVCAPTHPLALAGKDSLGVGRNYLQLVLTDRSVITEGQDFGVLGTRTWRLTDLESKHMLLLEGLGWGNMPLPHVLEDIGAGRLVRIELPDCKPGPYRFDVIYRTATPPGPAASFLIARFSEKAL